MSADCTGLGHRPPPTRRSVSCLQPYQRALTFSHLERLRRDRGEAKFTLRWMRRHRPCRRGRNVRMLWSLFAPAFALGFLLCLLPGAASAEAIRRGVARGFRSAVVFELGTLIGDAAWAVLALAGAAVLVQNRLVRLLLSIVGAAVLLRLATLALRDAM